MPYCLCNYVYATLCFAFPFFSPCVRNRGPHTGVWLQSPWPQPRGDDRSITLGTRSGGSHLPKTPHSLQGRGFWRSGGQSCGLSFPGSTDSTHRAMPEPHCSRSAGSRWAARCCGARTHGFCSYHEILFHRFHASCPRPGPAAVCLAVFAQPSSPMQVNASHLVMAEYDMGCDSMGGGAEQLQAPRGWRIPMKIHPQNTNLMFVETNLPTQKSRTACIRRGKFTGWTKWDFHSHQEHPWHLLRGHCEHGSLWWNTALWREKS